MSEVLHQLPFSSLAITVLFLPLFIAAKILTRDYKIRLKETIFIIIASFIGSIAFNINRALALDGFNIQIIEDSIMFLLFIIYYTKVKSYTVRKSLILAAFAMYAMLIFEFTWGAVTYFNFPAFQIGIVSYSMFFPLLLFSLGMSLIFIGFSQVFVRLTAKIRAIISENFQKKLATTSMASLLLLYVVTSAWRIQGYRVDIFSWQMIILLLLVGTILISFYFYMKSEQEKIALRQKEAEQSVLKHYTEQVEQQQVIIQKFMHDQQNVLHSIEGYLELQNLDGLKEYFYSQIKTSTVKALSDNIILSKLSKIKTPEIKATLASKLIYAESMDIETTFEVIDEIDYVPTSSLTVVRMLSIILDNAIEALIELQSGTLSVGCYKDGHAIVFVVENNCSLDLPPVSQVKELGFSTKAEGRGFGLANLSELVSAHPNISLQTSITDGKFIQRLSIGEI